MDFTDCFSVYDHNCDGMVSREEMFHHLKSSVVNLPPGEELDEVVKDLVGEYVCESL